MLKIFIRIFLLFQTDLQGNLFIYDDSIHFYCLSKQNIIFVDNKVNNFVQIDSNKEKVNF